MDESPHPDPASPNGPSVSIYDVAREAGVAASTVSRTFARPGRVSFATAEKVRAAAEKLGYRRENLVRASGRGDGASKMLGLVVADVGNPVFIEMLRGAEHAASQAGMTTVLADSRESPEREQEAVERILPVVDGLILAGARLPDAKIRTIAKQKATVVMNRPVRGVASVVIDQGQGARRAVEHLAEQGLGRIAYLGGPEASWADGARWSGVRDAAAAQGIQAHRMGPFLPTEAGGARAAEAWGRHRVPGVVAYNDLMALGFMRRLQAEGVRIPEDVRVIGFDDLHASRLVRPQLSSVVGPLDRMGATAAQHVLAIMNGARPSTERPVVLPAKLRARRSTVPDPQSLAPGDQGSTPGTPG